MVQNYVSISNVEGTLKVDEGRHTVPGEARVQIDEAMVCAALGKESKYTGRKVVCRRYIRRFNKILSITLQKQEGK